MHQQLKLTGHMHLPKDQSTPMHATEYSWISPWVSGHCPPETEVACSGICQAFYEKTGTLRQNSIPASSLFPSCCCGTETSIIRMHMMNVNADGSADAWSRRRPRYHTARQVLDDQKVLTLGPHCLTPHRNPGVDFWLTNGTTFLESPKKILGGWPESNPEPGA